jgi:hypothetical protein
VTALGDEAGAGESIPEVTSAGAVGPVEEGAAPGAELAEGGGVCPPHHWMIADNADPALLSMSCVRCEAVREQPRDPEPAWRSRGAVRGRGTGPAPTFGG